MSIQTIHVRTVPEYDVTIGPGLLKECGPRLREVVPLCHMAVITDSTVAPLYLETVKSSLEGAGFQVSAYIFPAGEGSKNFTTLLAAVDSSVGGKTAIDLSVGKNLAGAFKQPAAVLCDTDCLKTLPPDVFADGAAEALKTAVLCDESLFSAMEHGLRSSKLEEIIARCVAFKAGVVERDEKEQGERKLLNLGHTVGHAIEKCSNFAIPHGHAVAAGLAIMARAAEQLGWTDGPVAARTAACLEKNRLPISTSFEPRALAQAALSDKKRTGDSITIVVPRAIGHCELKKIHVSELEGIIRAGVKG